MVAINPYGIALCLLLSIATLSASLMTTSTDLSLGSLPSVVGRIYNAGFEYTNLTNGAYVVTGAVEEVTPPDAGWPVIIAYHGGNETSDFFLTYSALGNLAAIVIAPLGQHSLNGYAWLSTFTWLYQPPRNDAAFVNDILIDVSQKFPLDPSRIYVAGKSDGGGMALFNALFDELFDSNIRGVSTVSGAFYGIEEDIAVAPLFRFPATAQNYQTIGIPRKPGSVLDFHGTGDTVMRYDGGYDSNWLLSQNYDQPGNFFGKAQGFMTDDRHTANILEYYTKWSQVSNDVEQEADIQLLGDDALLQPISLYTWSSFATKQSVQHIQVPGGEHCWYGHPTLIHNCSDDLNLQIDATSIIAKYFNIPLLASYISPATTLLSPTVPLRNANPTGLIDLSYQHLVAPGTVSAKVNAILWQTSTQFFSSDPSWQVGFFEILNLEGQVKDTKTGRIVSPDEEGWREAAVDPDNIILLPPLSTSSASVSFDLEGGKIYSSFVMGASTNGKQQKQQQQQDVSTPFDQAPSLQVIDLGGESFAYQQVSTPGKQESGNQFVFTLNEISLV